MSVSIKVLLVEDSDQDAELALKELKRAKLDFVSRRVQAESDLRRSLQDFAPDIVLSDFSMPGFSGLAALKICKEWNPDVPFILMSGTVGEDVAVEAMKAGANDYLMKDSLVRLAPAVARELREAEQRRRRDADLKRFRLALDNSADLILITDRATMRHVDVNQTACRLLGYTREELLQIGPAEILPLSRAELEAIYDALIANPSSPGGMQSHYRCKDGSLLPFESTRHVLRADNTWLIAAISRDIRQRQADEARLRDSEERFRSLSMLSSDWFWAQDEECRFIEFAGGDHEKGWGLDQRSTVGMRRWELPGVSPVSGSWDEHKALLAAHKPFRDFEYQRVLDNGAVRYISASGEPVFDAGGRFAGYRGVATDITRRKESEEKIKRLNRVHAVLSGINALIVRVRERDELFRESCRVAVEAGGFRMAWIGIVDRTAMEIRPAAWYGADEAYIRKMPLWLTDTGVRGQGLAGRAVLEKVIISVEDMTQDPRVLLKEEAGQRGFHSLVMLPLVIAEQSLGVLALYAGEVGFFDEEEMKLLGELAGDIAFAVDHIDKAEKLEYLAYHDPLTGLANRSLLQERLEQAIAAAAREKRKLALVIQDIERFKDINDSLGRQAGDTLLKQYAERLTGVARDATWTARVGADHFAVLVPDVTSEEELARRTEERVRSMYAKPFRVGEVELTVSARLGIAVYPADGEDADTLFRNAEAALKKAKATGERYLFYRQQMTERIAEKLALENKLRRALERQEFVLHYQPKVDVETRALVGVEALLRWQSPDLGLVPPLKFISLLEETGLIMEVGSWALNRAALDHRSLVERGFKAPRVAVNVSSIQLRQRDFVAVVEAAILSGLAPTGIDLEITESLVMDDIERNIEKLKDLRKLGIGLAIDDFGTGYSSLAYLAKLPVQTIKIDRSFIITMLADPDRATLVQTVITLARSLKLKVVAEGVDSEEQARFLKLLRCDQMQGYLFSKPVPLDELVAMLEKSPGAGALLASRAS